MERKLKKNRRPKFVGITWENIARRLLQIKKKKNNDEFLGYVIYVKSCIFLSWINMLPCVMSGVLYVFALFFAGFILNGSNALNRMENEWQGKLNKN